MDGGVGRDHHEDKDGEMNPFWGFPAPKEHRRGRRREGWRPAQRPGVVARGGGVVA
jgi:hypothetical protein